MLSIWKIEKKITLYDSHCEFILLTVVYFWTIKSDWICIKICFDEQSNGNTLIPILSKEYELRIQWITKLIIQSGFFFDQAVIFHVERHPVFEWFEQCVTFKAFPTPEFELAYNLAGTVAMYLGPLSAIAFCYGAIVIRLYRNGKSFIIFSFKLLKYLFCCNIHVVLNENFFMSSSLWWNLFYMMVIGCE